jgi:F-box domain
MPLRTSARLKERIEDQPPAHPCNTTLQIVTSTSFPRKKHKSDAAPNTDSAQPGKYDRIKGKKKGRLVFMTEMPIDILFEIFAQLEPVDLLHLSRASKDLRNILITSNANFLWKLVYVYVSIFSVPSLSTQNCRLIGIYPVLHPIVLQRST